MIGSKPPKKVNITQVFNVVCTTAKSTGIYQTRCKADEILLLVMDRYSPKHVEHLMENQF
jgi:hypothetical protein